LARRLKEKNGEEKEKELRRMKDVIERLNDAEEYIDAIDDAIQEIEELRELLRECIPYVEDMIGIASSARPLKQAIDEHLLKV
jgi:prefoldin subunit 5